MLLAERGINKRTLNALAKKKIYTENDLVRWVPRYYKDYREPLPVTKCRAGEYCAVSCAIRFVDAKEGKKKYLSLSAMSFESNNSSMFTPVRIFFFTRTFLYQTFYGMIGKEVVVTGKVTYDETYGYNISEPDEIVFKDRFRPEIVPVYSRIGGVSDEMFQKLLLSSFCILRSDDTQNERLKVIASTTDGFEIAEADLRLRGSGDLLGTEQAGLNRYVELMLSRPLDFQRAQKLADFCIQNGFGQRLLDLYTEGNLDK